MKGPPLVERRAPPTTKEEALFYPIVRVTTSDQSEARPCAFGQRRSPNLACRAGALGL